MHFDLVLEKFDNFEQLFIYRYRFF